MIKKDIDMDNAFLEADLLADNQSNVVEDPNEFFDHNIDL